MATHPQQEPSVLEIYNQTQEEFKNIRNNCKRNADPILQRNEKYVTIPIMIYIYSLIIQNQNKKQQITSQI